MSNQLLELTGKTLKDELNLEYFIDRDPHQMQTRLRVYDRQNQLQYNYAVDDRTLLRGSEDIYRHIYSNMSHAIKKARADLGVDELTGHKVRKIDYTNIPLNGFSSEDIAKAGADIDRHRFAKMEKNIYDAIVRPTPVKENPRKKLLNYGRY